MLIIQSTRQSIFDRIYTIFAQFFWYIAITLFFALFTNSFPSNITFGFYTILAITVIITIWLVIFNTGESKIIEHGLELNDQGITYIDYGNKLTIKWTDFVGFHIKKRLPRSVTIKSSDSKDIEFSYYMFSYAQRKKVFEYLAAK